MPLHNDVQGQSSSDATKPVEPHRHEQIQLQAQPGLKPGTKAEEPAAQSGGTVRAPSPSPSFVSIGDSIDVRFSVSRSNSTSVRYQHDRTSVPQKGWKSRVQAFWLANKGLALVLIAQFFGTLMNVTTRILEMEGNDGKVFQLRTS